MSVIVPGWIERQVDLYRVAYLAIVFDDLGEAVLDYESGKLRTESRYVQLEGPPLPWPEEIR